MLNILISNDDGVFAPGLAALAETIKQLAHITVVAPDRNRSGASNSLTLDNPIRLRQAANGFIMVEGTPTDCVHLAITGYLDHEPDMVVTGINWGANLGDDVLYSGTVAAAMEGRFLGYPALAFSLAGESCHFFDTAAYVVNILINQVIKNPLPADTILNINIPDIPVDELTGFEVTRLGHRHRAEPVTKMTDPRGHPIYWVGPAGDEQDAGPGTDFYAINHGRVSITPLQVDLTRYTSLEAMSAWTKELTL